ncbi:hypothetical protein O181_055828 [Austropuccinia psidii MF-1]|uniref:Uncharacterized protein n=1 Tax=Austropuccinia psidii MF-1 TaxID=1389203 RepID=A0A9Q3HSV9_9BASI|nr:hypothetical protein [Austropuccinia psidii MF-1]
MQLTTNSHINTIFKVWVITPHGARKQFGMPIFVHEMTSSLPPDHLTPLPCLLSCMKWLLYHPLIISASRKDRLPLLSLPLHNHPFLHLPCSCSRCTLMICLQHCHPMSSLTHAYALEPRSALMISL